MNSPRKKLLPFKSFITSYLIFLFKTEKHSS